MAPRTVSRRTVLGGLALGAGTLATGCFPRGAVAVDVKPSRPALPVRAVRAADFKGLDEGIAALLAGGALDFVKEGQTVLLKPAVNSGYGAPATTDPALLLAVGSRIKERGAKLIVADRSMLGRDTRETFRSTQLDAAAKELGAELRFLEDEPVLWLSHPQARHWPRHAIPLTRTAREADHLVVLASTRTHVLSGYTMGMKCLVGLVHGPARIGMHHPMGLEERVAELSLVATPSLVVLDGRRGFVSGGPDSGDRADPGLLLAGSDPVAVDAVGLAALRLADGQGPLHDQSLFDLPQLARAAELGLGAGGPADVSIAGLDETQRARLMAELAA